MALIVFDIDGTLCNTKSMDDRCYLDSLQECWGCQLGEVDWSSFRNVTDSGLAREIFKSFFQSEIGEEELRALQKLFVAKIKQGSEQDPAAFQEIKGAAQFVKALQEENVPIAIATGGWKQSAAYKLKHIGLELDQIPHATSDDHEEREEILKKSIGRASEYYGKDFERILYVGDGLWDLKACQALGIAFIGIDSGENGKLVRAGAKMVFKDFNKSDEIKTALGIGT